MNVIQILEYDTYRYLLTTLHVGGSGVLLPDSKPLYTQDPRGTVVS